MTSSTHVERVLAAAGYRPAGRSATGATLGVALDGSDRRVELEVVAADDEVRSRWHALRDLHHDHLPRVLEVVELHDEQLAVFTEHVVGTTLEQVCGARGPLGPGESVTVAIPVAQALDALHRSGLVHGAVSARAIVLDPAGRPVLTCAGSSVGRGAQGAEPRQDVRALLALLLAHLDRGPAAGATEEDPAGRDAGLGAALEDLLRADRDGEPVTADRVVGRCFRTCAPRPVRLPTRDELRRVALTAGTVGALRRPRTEPDRARARPGPGGRRLALLGVGGTVLVAAAVVGLLTVTRPAGPARAVPEPAAAVTTRASSVDTPSDPQEAARALTARRAELLVAGEVAGLAEVEVVDGPAHTADAALLGELAGDRLDGLRVHVERVTALPAEAADEARVLVGSSASAYERLAGDGTVVATGPAATTDVVLVLRWTDAGWRVWDVAAPPG
ncbi:protein kinase [Cellulomonas sp. DKR-3]|uniref:Protein kinase n=1 Tax=Cellulomonas fulva TaxID=2835530 RepID=A0ABS5U0A5_9CELL|nr:protein kinase [Cellulomonas fulva]MBT0994834.1 protein kinase [Cellulomonas fulva]